ncbi:MAG: RNA 2',3'-cyclic phosphodiesterase, partial [Bdellovibrionota bacterium]
MTSPKSDSEQNKRLFIGVPVIVGVSLEAALKKIRITAQKREMEFDWVPSSNFHVTLSFLGDTPVSKLPALETLLKEVAARNSPCETSIKGMGAFPDEHHMRVMWIGVRKSRSLALLNDDLRETLEKNGFPPDPKE